MTFVQATNVFMGRVTLKDVADSIGCSLQTLKQARLNPESAHHRRPPQGWEAVLAQLARSRIRELEDLARTLEA
jgi:hypothetical protein